MIISNTSDRNWPEKYSQHRRCPGTSQSDIRSRSWPAEAVPPVCSALAGLPRFKEQTTKLQLSNVGFGKTCRNLVCVQTEIDPDTFGPARIFLIRYIVQGMLEKHRYVYTTLLTSDLSHCCFCPKCNFGVRVRHLFPLNIIQLKHAALFVTTSRVQWKKSQSSPGHFIEIVSSTWQKNSIVIFMLQYHAE